MGRVSEVAGEQADMAELAEAVLTAAEVEARETDPKDALLDDVIELAEVRSGLARATAKVHELQAAWERENAAVLEMKAKLSARTKELTERIRTRAVDIYEVTGNKKPAPGIEVKGGSAIELGDPAAVLAWCIEHRIALAVDERMVRKLAGIVDGPWIDVPVTSATIAMDLDKALNRSVPEKPEGSDDAQSLS